MNRRDVILSTGSMAVSASLGALACGGGTAVAQGPKPPPSPPPPAPGHAHHPMGDAALLEAAHGCLAKGDACIAHCLMMFSSGDTSMADCAKTVRDMHAMMHGLAAAAASGSKHLAATAKVAMEYCKDCEAACRRHADKHPVCKECAEACAKTIAACQKAAA
jgi:Cys-rich four helix bundle protein (predicted Tat secretion target)